MGAYSGGRGGGSPALALVVRCVGEGFGVHPVVVLGQHRAGLPRPVGQGATAYLATRHGKPGNRYRETR